MRQYILILSLIILSTWPSYGVEKGKNFDNTLNMLCLELESLKAYQPIATAQMESQRKQYMQTLQNTKERADELSIVLFSQRNINLFAQTYSTRQVQDLCDQFDDRKYPFSEWHKNFNDEIERYNKLQRAIESIDSAHLTPSSRQTRQRAINDCQTISTNLYNLERRLDMSDQKFTQVDQQLEYLRHCTDSSYAMLRHELFLVLGNSYINIISNFEQNFNNARQTVNNRYFNTDYYSHLWVSSLNRFLIFALLLLIVATGLAYATIRWIIKIKTRGAEFQAKWRYYWVVLTLMIHSVMLIVAIQLVSIEELVIHAMILNVELSWLISTILLSLIVRMPSDKLRIGLMLYMPNMALGALLIMYRVLMTPNEVVGITFPPIILAILLWYTYIIFKHGRSATRTDIFYSWLSFVIILGGTILAWVGHPFVSLLTQMLWLITLSSIQMLITLNKLLLISDNKYRVRHNMTQPTWFYAMMLKLILPIMCIMIILCSCLWTSHIFDMSDMLLDAMLVDFVHIPTVASISIIKLIWVIFLAICINYLIFVLREILRSIYGAKCDSGILPIFMTIGPLMTWGLYICSVMVILDVDSAGLLVVMGGLSMGIGFALKETIDNLFCGLALMLGRAQLGDIVECDGMRGKIISIGYRSTMIETIDGSMIAFLNNQLFTKNFKNLTRNHTYELARITIGMEYGTNIEHAHQMILEGLDSIHNLSKEQATVVNFQEFGSSNINLTVNVWVPVHTREATLSSVKGCIYTALKKSGIKINTVR